MNMDKFNLFLIMCVFLLSGCSGRQKENLQSDCIVIQVPSLEIDSVFDLPTFSKESFYVKLATEDSCLVGKINKMFYIKGHIVIGSDNNVILFFNKDGTFDHRIYHQGDAPGEYLRISDFDINKETGVISVLDTRKRQLLRYDWNGNYLSKNDLNYWSIAVQQLNDSVDVLYSGNQVSQDNGYKFTVYTSKTDKVEHRFSPIDESKALYLHVHSANNFSKCGSEVLFCELYNDTIYSITSSGCTPRYYLDFGEGKVPSSFYDTNYANIVEFQKAFQKYGFSYGINSLANLPNGFVASCFLCMKKCYLYYNQPLQKVTTFIKLGDKEAFGDFAVDINKHKVKFYSDEEYLFMIADNDLYMNNATQVLKGQLGAISLEDNPIVRVCRIGLRK